MNEKKANKAAWSHEHFQMSNNHEWSDIAREHEHLFSEMIILVNGKWKAEHSEKFTEMKYLCLALSAVHIRFLNLIMPLRVKEPSELF